MTDDYKEIMEDTEVSDDELFMEEVIREDYDLLVIDSLLSEAFGRKSKEN